MQRDRRMEAGGEPPFPPGPESGVTDPAPSAPGSSMTAALPTQSDQRARFALLWVVPILVAGAVSFAPPILNDADTFWHIAAGRWMIAHGAVPATDPFSYTFAGRPWVAHEWLSELAMAAAFIAAGWSGVMLLTGAAVGVVAAIMDRWLIRWLAPLPALLALALGFACLAPGMLARPHLLALPVLALWTVGLLEARQAGRAPPIWLPLVMMLWANLHSSFIVGLLIAAALALEALLDLKAWRRRTLIGWAAFLGLCLVASLATPHGIEGLVFPLRVIGMKTLPAITEWAGPDFFKGSPLEIVLLGGLWIAFWRGVGLGALRALILLGLVHMSLQHVRQEVLLGVVAPLILAEPFGRTMSGATAAGPGWRLPAPQTALGVFLVSAVVLGRLLVPMVRVDGPTAPIAALAHVPPALRAQPVLNDYDFGGYLIFEGVRPYIDGRADMYGDDFVANDALVQGANQAAMDWAIAHYHIRWSILRPDRPTVAALDRTPGWKRLYADKYAVVQVRMGP
jgi:hypothetical protein